MVAVRAVLLCAAVAATGLAVDKKEIDVGADQTWVDSEMDVKAGDALSITATGSVAYGPQTSGPDGLKRGWPRRFSRAHQR